MQGEDGALRECGLAALAARFGERFSRSAALREQHGHTVTWLANEPPEAVVFPDSTPEVQEIVRQCARHRLPIIPFGTGTSVEGQVNAPAGGVSIDFSRMQAILAVNEEDMDCVVQPGVTRKALNEHLRDKGLFFPIDPGADASLGGMAATRASGTNAVRYGTMREAVVAVKAVMADGEVLTSARRARKSASGYDLTRLLVGSEGTLGIITELTLRLHGIPEAISGGYCPFPDVEAACNAVIMTIQLGIPVARIELLDAAQVKACNVYSNLGLPEAPMLFLEFHGSEGGVAEQSEKFAAIAGDCGGGDFHWSTMAEERTRLWQARHDAYWAAKALRPGASSYSTDVCVPISRLAECVAETRRALEAARLVGTILGHVGDGNFHVLLLVDGQDARERAAVDTFLRDLIARSLAAGGTCSGEHGIGQGKAKYLAAEHGVPAVRAMRLIKRALDPGNILNPGKLFDAAD
ncbi:FAD-binding oxidoreductase [Methylobacterium frigidaeris]|nr:FAD-linked oxidase C-terminal domain-containing protein [Methylobacterium frigidaeris]